ncbi:ABC transporter substrate-binding protein [Allorhizocola rhizosphaerae]|uniref:ABC transporter substrate-binding protein n=1 Tax=Allorhizocola rhizosphaerae TaxID=1872709 RepID=UPI000E3D0C9A|nr:ABC transporter substrate-binding protein [Allorhizocola rhizosphaerae]
MHKRALLLAATAAALLAITSACTGGGSAPAEQDALSPTDPSKVTGEVTVLTHRTDLVQDGTMKKYADEFKKTYPNVTIKYDAITDYEGEVKIRMNTENYGDVLMIPAAIQRNDYPKFFASLGGAADLSAKYRFTSNTTVNDKVYGLAGFGGVNGFIYNKEVWAAAGVTKWPTSSEEFLAALAAIKAKGASVPFYTNYKDGWPLSQLGGALGAISCDPKARDKLAAKESPWKAGSDLRAIDTLLFNIVKNQLIESDPATTNWEDSKGLLATGKIATMGLGSWSIVQMQDAAKKAGKDPSIIGYMPFPALPGGKPCAVLGPDYAYAVNIHSKVKPAARAFIDFMTDKSGFAESNQSVAVLKSAPMPAALKPFSEAGVQLIELTQEKAGEVDKIDKLSEIGALSTHDYRQKLVDIARGAAPGDLNGYLDELGKKWVAAVP